LIFSDLGGLAKVMPLAGLAFGFGAFAAIGLPGFANFAAEIMVFFGSFQKGWDMNRFHMFQVTTVLALWGVVISAVYMLRAYRYAFMGAMPDRWKELPDLKRSLRIPLILLVGALIWFGFFPQSLVRLVSPSLRHNISEKFSP
jgi:NADH-quinone oxidoreductase subunit M